MLTPNKRRRPQHNIKAAHHPDFAIVASRYNEEISAALLKGALDCFQKNKILKKNITIVRVPGAFELPVTAQRLAETKKYAAVICLGAVIRGETAHFEHVARECARGIQQAALRTGVPVIFGVLTTETFAQASARSQNNSSNKGWECALAALDMAAVINTHFT